MDSDAEDEKKQRPEAPDFPKWAAACGWIALVIYFSGRGLLDLEGWGSFVLSLPLAIPWLIGCFIYYRAQKRHEILYLRWQISSLKRSIKYREKNLMEGQPWFDDQCPSEWEFDQKYWARQAKEKIEDLEQNLEEKLRAM